MTDPTTETTDHEGTMTPNDLTAEGLGWVAETLAAEMPGGKPPSPATINRYVRAGILTPAGRVRLEVVRIGSRLATSRAAVKRFIAAQQTGYAGPVADVLRSPEGRNRAAVAAGNELAAMGC